MECAESRALYKVLLQNGRRGHQAGQTTSIPGCSLLHGGEALVTGTQLAVAVFQLTTDLAALVGLGEAALLLGVFGFSGGTGTGLPSRRGRPW